MCVAPATAEEGNSRDRRGWLRFYPPRAIADPTWLTMRRKTKPLLVHCPNSRFNPGHRGTWKPSDPRVKRPTGIPSRIRFPLRSRNLGREARPIDNNSPCIKKGEETGAHPRVPTHIMPRGPTLMRHHLEPVQAPGRNTPMARDYATVCEGLAGSFVGDSDACQSR